MSIFTPQQGATDEEILSAEERIRVIEELQELRMRYPILDMNDAVLREFLAPPRSPAECIFARSTHTISADLKTRIQPCQFGGKPDCSQCGCLASMGLAAVGHHQIAPGITLGKLFHVSQRLGENIGRFRNSQREVA